jgi:hypothetical protein
MKKTLLKNITMSITAASILTLLCVHGSAFAETCPNPLPNCTSSGPLADLSGKFACTGVKTGSDGIVRTELLLLNVNGGGGLSGTQAQNQNSTDPSTYSDFAPIPSGTIYCVNTDDSGYITPPAGNGCPLAFVIDNGGAGVRTEVRLLSTQQNRAEAIVCKKQ